VPTYDDEDVTVDKDHYKEWSEKEAGVLSPETDPHEEISGASWTLLVAK